MQKGILLDSAAAHKPFAKITKFAPARQQKLQKQQKYKLFKTIS